MNRVTEDPIPQFLRDVKDIFVAGARAQAANAAPYRQPPAIAAYRFIAYRMDDEAKEEKWLFAEDPSMDPLVRSCRDRFLETARGKAVLNDLARLFYEPSTKRYTSVVHITFAPHEEKSIFSGEVAPEGQHAPHYWAKVEIPVPLKGPFAETREEAARLYPGQSVVLLGGPDGGQWWPAEQHPTTGKFIPCRIQFFYIEPASVMAETLHHELLHIWYFHEGAKQTYSTGHGTVEQQLECGYEADFVRPVGLMMGQLDAIEKANRRR